MATNRKVIITCASTGSIHTPTMSEYLPLTPEQIAEQSIAAAEAGAAILHHTPAIPKMAAQHQIQMSSCNSYHRSKKLATLLLT